MDIIDNFDKLPIGRYMEIQEVSRDESLDEIERQSRYIAILTGHDVDEILHLPIGEYKILAAKASFLDPEKVGKPDYIKMHPIAKRYIIGGYELHPVRDYRKLEAGQYVDFQTFAQDLDKYLVEFLSVILVPHGTWIDEHGNRRQYRYNEGYDIVDVQNAIREEMSVADGCSLAAFFLTWSRQSILNSLNYSRKEAMRIKDKAKREEILKRIAEQERLLMPIGDGSEM